MVISARQDERYDCVESRMFALSKYFAKAGLELRIEKTPLVLGSGRLGSVDMQLDIARNRDHERYVLFPGNENANRLDVSSADRSLRQLVLVVDQPARGVRNFLCGRDEAHLFIALLPRVVANVTDAHEALAPEIPQHYARGIIRRQGEWFFAAVTADERAELNLVSQQSIRAGGLAEIARIRRHGRQHIATQACLLETRPSRLFGEREGSRLYARGQIWHPDHAPLALRGWHRVFLNREPFERVSPRIPGVRWVD